MGCDARSRPLVVRRVIKSPWTIVMSHGAWGMGHASVTSDMGVIRRHTHTWEKASVYILTKPLSHSKEYAP